MSALTGDKLDFRRIEDPDPETVTRRRLASNREFGMTRGPSPYELEMYRKFGKEPPTE